MKQRILFKTFLVLFLLIAGRGITFTQNCVCAMCGCPCGSPASAHTNPSCPVYIGYHSGKGGGTIVNKTSLEQDILVNLFSGLLNNLISGSSKQDKEKERLEEEQQQKTLAMLLAKQMQYNDSIAQVNHNKMMKDYIQLEGKGDSKFIKLDDDSWKSSIHFNCKITSFKGDVTVLKSNGERIVLSTTQSADLTPGDWIATGKNGRLKMHYAFEDGGEDIILGSNSAINIVTNEEGTHIPKLMKGNMYSVNNKLKEELTEKTLDAKDELSKDIDKLATLKNRFEVRTPAAICGVRGTEFTVHVDESDNTEVNVKNGIIDLTGNLIQGTIILTAGSKGIVKGTGVIVGPLKIDEKHFDEAKGN